MVKVWVLIMVIHTTGYGAGVSVSTQDGFSSREGCAAAGEQFIDMKDDLPYYAKFFFKCVKQ